MNFPLVPVNPGQIASNGMVGTRSAKDEYVMRMIFVSSGDRTIANVTGPPQAGPHTTL
jgi:hypothetical protein